MEDLICDLQCGIQQRNVPCHATTDTVAMLTHKLTLRFGGKLGILHLVKYSAIFNQFNVTQEKSCCGNKTFLYTLVCTQLKKVALTHAR